MNQTTSPRATTGILETSLSRLVRAETFLRLDKTDVSADYLWPELVNRKAR